MRKLLGKFTKHGAIVLASTLAIGLNVQPAQADTLDTPFLQAIQNNTTSILQSINTLPILLGIYLAPLNQLATTLLASDNSSSDPVDWSTNWSTEQNSFANLSSNTLNNEAYTYDMQTQLLTTFFGGSISATAPNPANLNDITYTTLLGIPLVSPDPRENVNSAVNYLSNASGLSLPFVIPGTGWRGDEAAQTKYSNFYNTVTSVQTYNAYVLSRLYQDSQHPDAPLRRQLITQSSNSNWFSSVITNDLGWVLRQILLYNSQIYVVMDQLLQTQKQMLAATAMTNTLFIANSQFQSDMLLNKAQSP